MVDILNWSSMPENIATLLQQIYCWMDCYMAGLQPTTYNLPAMLADGSCLGT